MFLDFNLYSFEKKTKQLLEQHGYLNAMYCCGITEVYVMNKIKEFVPALTVWAKKFLRQSPDEKDGMIDFRFGAMPDADGSVSLAVSDVVDIEENILCPSLGLKGKGSYVKASAIYKTNLLILWPRRVQIIKLQMVC